MSGREKGTRSGGPRLRPDEWFDLADLATGRIIGQVTWDGHVRHADTDTIRRINAAFDQEIMLRDEAIADELGVCFADVETVASDDGRHNDLVFRNLGLLTGFVPQQSNEPETRQSS